MLGSLRWTPALVYIDDIIRFYKNIKEHANHGKTLLDAATAVVLKFNPAKCHFAYLSIQMLEHRVFIDGLDILDDRAAAIKEIAKPRNLKELWHVLGIFGYYRQFILRYTIIAAPLTKITKGTRFKRMDDGTWEPREASPAATELLWGE